MVTRSLRWRLQLWLGFLLVCLLSGFGVTVYQLHRINQFEQIDLELGRRVAALNVAVRSATQSAQGPEFVPPEWHPGDPPFENPRLGPPPVAVEELPSAGGTAPLLQRRELHLSPEVLSLFGGGRPESFYFSVWFRDGSLLRQSKNAPADIPCPGHKRGDTQTHIRIRGSLRESYHFTELGDCLVAGRSVTTDLAGLSGFAVCLLAAGGGILAIGLGVGSWLTSRAIRPVEAISAAADCISAGNLSARIVVANPGDELGRLSQVLNSTFARLEAAFERQRRFTADASHELRTPLAVLISEAQTALARNRSAAEYRDTVETCLGVAQEMRRLTESLLELARSDAGQAPVPRVPLDLARSARESVERLRPRAAERGIHIHCDLEPALTFGNTDRFGLVIANLLTNAIHYNKPQGDIRVMTRREDGNALMIVEDTGQGIPAEELPYIFERFFRSDKSRSLAEGRFGLGLAICRALLGADGGQIEVASELGVGTRFTVRMPA